MVIEAVADAPLEVREVVLVPDTRTVFDEDWYAAASLADRDRVAEWVIRNLEPELRRVKRFEIAADDRSHVTLTYWSGDVMPVEATHVLDGTNEPFPKFMRPLRTKTVRFEPFVLHGQVLLRAQSDESDPLDGFAVHLPDPSCVVLQLVEQPTDTTTDRLQMTGRPADFMRPWCSYCRCSYAAPAGTTCPRCSHGVLGRHADVAPFDPNERWVVDVDSSSDSSGEPLPSPSSSQRQISVETLSTSQIVADGPLPIVKLYVRNTDGSSRAPVDMRLVDAAQYDALRAAVVELQRVRRLSLNASTSRERADLAATVVDLACDLVAER